MGEVTLYDGSKLVNVHDEGLCAGRHCAIHNPSDHPLNAAPMAWLDGGINALYRVCEHGYQHPDPDDLAFKRLTWQWAIVEAISSTHLMKENCDGCCYER